MTKQTQPARQANIKAIADFFRSGIKDQAQAVGIELEHTVVKHDGQPVSYEDEYGQKWMLKQLHDDFPQILTDSTGDMIGISNGTSTVTLEPAAQVELSAGPFTNLTQAKECFQGFERKLENIIAPHGMELLTPGYHPTRRAIDLTLIPKKRYALMNEYLGAISSFGICMMRGSAATQVAIDYTSEADCLRKLRLANACVPILALICDNSPIFEGEIRPHQLMRTEIWEKCDPDRCNTVPGVMTEEFTLEDYAAYILDTPAIVDKENHEQILSSRTFGEIFADRQMTQEDIEHALSMFFTDIRLKTYIEVRPADAMPAECVVAYAALVKGLFYSEESLAALDGLFRNVTEQDIWDAKRSLMEHGYEGYVYHHPASEIADELISIATTALSDEECTLMQPLADLVAHRTTLANVALEQV